MSNTIHKTFWNVAGTSPPFAVYRNKERHVFSNTTGNNIPVANMEANAWSQTLYYKNKLGEHPIPSYLLFDYIMQDMYLEKGIADSKYQPVSNSLLGCHHGDENFLTHPSGRDLDQLIIRPVASLMPQNGGDIPGFTVELSHPIDQLESAGTSQWNTCSHMLARSSTRVTHVRTVRVFDHTTHSYNDNRHSKGPVEAYDPVILEPLQMWQLPDTILDMSTHPSSLSLAVMLTKHMRLHTWDPIGGISQVIDRPIFLPAAISPVNPLISFSSHPQVCWLSNAQCVYSIDLRAPPSPKRIYESPSAVRGLLQHGRHTDMLLIARDETLDLVDMRYTRCAIGSTILPKVSDGAATRNHMSYHSGESFGIGSTDVVLGYKSTSRQLLLHNLQLQSTSDDHNLYNEESFTACDLFSLVSTAAASSISDTNDLRWNTTGFPVIDRTGPSASPLIGATILPSHHSGNRNRNNNGNRNEDENDDENNNKDNDNDIYKDGVGFRAMLCQQCKTGDVFVQEIRFVSTHKRRVKSEYGMRSGSGSGSVFEELPPVQMELPCGIRCPPLPTPTASNNNSNTNSHSRVVQPRLRLRLGTGLGKTLIPPDIGKHRHHRYPLASSSFTPFVDEMSMKRFNLIRLRKEDLEQSHHRPSVPKKRDIPVEKGADIGIDTGTEKRPRVPVTVSMESLLREAVAKGKLTLFPECSESNYDNDPLKNPFPLPALPSVLPSHPMTLWEVWNVVVMVMQGDKRKEEEGKERDDGSSEVTATATVGQGDDAASRHLNGGETLHWQELRRCVKALYPHIVEELLLMPPISDQSTLFGDGLHVCRQPSQDSATDNMSSISPMSYLSCQCCSALQTSFGNGVETPSSSPSGSGSPSGLQDIDIKPCHEASCLLPHALVYRRQQGTGKQRQKSFSSSSSSYSVNTNIGSGLSGDIIAALEQDWPSSCG
eukprot:gene9618-20000_t